MVINLLFSEQPTLQKSNSIMTDLTMETPKANIDNINTSYFSEVDLSDDERHHRKGNMLRQKQ